MWGRGNIPYALIRRNNVRRHFILTTLTAYAPWEGLRAADVKKGVRHARMGRTRKQLAEFLGHKKSLAGTTIDLQPLIVSFRGEQHETEGWCYEQGGDDDSFLGHMSSLYEVTTDEESAPETIHRMIDSIHAARAVIDHLIDSEIVAFPIDLKWIPKRRCVLMAHLTQYYHATTHPASRRNDFENLFSFRTGSSGATDWTTWRLVPLFMKEERLLYSALFLKASLHEYTFHGDEIEEAILNNDGPLFVHDAVRAENAVHNAYKVIEAIWGGNLPEEQGKIERGLRDKGVDPCAMVGYSHHGIHPKEQLVAKVLKLRKARNEKTAHGRIHTARRSTYYEVMDYQALARAVLLMHIRHLFPDCGL
jgi:hypothetical protein